MAIALRDARICLDCETIFDEPKCPRCDTAGSYPLAQWVKPTVDSEKPETHSAAVRNALLLLVGAGSVYGLWTLLNQKGRPDE